MKMRCYWLVVALIGAYGLTGCAAGEGPQGTSGPQGEPGPAPVVNVESEVAGENCPFGGVRVSIGDEAPFFVCKGEDGRPGGDGRDGEDGEDGEDGIAPSVTVEAIGEEDTDHNCAAGGVKVTVDPNDGSDVVVEFVCNGEPGTKGVGAEFTITEFAAGDEGENCGTTGGVKITTPDVDDDGNDISVDYFICNGETGDAGANGTQFSVRTATDDECAAGGYVIVVDGVDYAVCDGADGSDGDTPAISFSRLFADVGDHGCQEAGGYVVTFTTSVETVSFEICNGAGVESEPLGIGLCNIQFPTTIEMDGYGTEDVYSRLYIEGVTGAQASGEERPDTLLAQLGYGAVGSEPNDDWTWINAERNTGFAGNDDQLNNDEYFATLAYLWPGTYEYLFRYSGDGGENWTNCLTSSAERGLATIAFPGVVASWDFDDQITDATFGFGTITHGSGGIGAWAGGLSGLSWSFTGWDLTPLNGEGGMDSSLAVVNLDSLAHFEIAVDLSPVSDLTFSFAGNRSNTGPKQFALAYSIGGADFVTIETRPVPTANWESYEFDLVTLVPGLANQADVRLRIYGFDASGSGGTWRVDDVFLGFDIL